MKKGEKYSCYAIFGNSKDYFGIWEVIMCTQKQYKLQGINNQKIRNFETINGKFDNRHYNYILHIEDNSFTIYINRQGVPFIFDKIE